MSKKTKLEPLADWELVSPTGSEWDSIDTSTLEKMYVTMFAIRQFETTALGLWTDGLVHGPLHGSIGQEACAVGTVAALTVGDLVNFPHRAHHHFLAKALYHVGEPTGLLPGTGTRDILKRTLAEIMGLKQGWCRGRGGSMHLYWREAGIMGANAIVGGGVPHAAGIAWGLKNSGSENCMIGFVGDGATNAGNTLESLNLSALYNVPMCLVVENNQYAVSTRLDESTRETRLSARGVGFGMTSYTVDGMDVVAMYNIMKDILEQLRAGKGPVLLEVNTYRFIHHSGLVQGSAMGYRDKEEEGGWKVKDSIQQVRQALIDRGVDANSLEATLPHFEEMMTSIVDELVESNDGSRKIVAALWPSPDEIDVGVRSDLSELEDVRYCEQDQFSGELKAQKFVDVIAECTAFNMRQDTRILVMGEDIHQLRGGTNGATKGLRKEFPERVLPTPISEHGFIGMACGMALEGSVHPVVELMYADFAWVAADQIINQIGKVRQMFGGDDEVPLVMRTKIGIGTGYGSQHSMDPIGLFMMSPGWRVVAPRTAYDYVGLMNSALRCNDPVLIVEHVSLYETQSLAPADDFDYCIPLGKACKVRSGSGITLVGYLNMVNIVQEVVERLGIDAEIIDLRSVDRAGIDWEMIGESVSKTNNIAVLEEGPLCTSMGAQLSDEIQRRFFDDLDQPVLRVHGGETAPAVSKVLEAATMAGTEKVEAMLIQAMADIGEPISTNQPPDSVGAG